MPDTTVPLHAPDTSPSPSGSADAQGSPAPVPPIPPGDAPDTKASTALGGLVLLLIGLALVFVIGTAVSETVDSFGIVDRRLEAVRFAAAMLGALLTALGSNVVLKAIKPSWGWKQQVPLFVLMVAAVVAATTAVFVRRVADGEAEEGTLTSAEPFARRILLSGGNGYRYYVTLETSGDLQARLDVRGSGTPVPGVLQSDGRTLVAEGVLVGDTTWTALATYINGEGKYLLFVDSAEPETLTMSPDPLRRGFDAGRSRSGYIFSLAKSSNVYLKVAEINEQAMRPGMLLRDSDGTPMDNVPIGGDGTIFTRLPAGEYVLTILGSPDQRFSLIFSDSDPSAVGEDPPEPPSGTVNVPDVSGQPEPIAVKVLTDAGFVVQTVAVCSDSLAAANAPVGTTRQVVVSGAASAADEIEVVGSSGVTTDRLPAGTALDLKSFNGLACEVR